MFWTGPLQGDRPDLGFSTRPWLGSRSASMSADMDGQVNPLERDHSLCVVLPSGPKKSVTVHGSKPVMDLLVTLCASYHLNPSDYTVEFLSHNKNNISFKPNSPVGSLEAEKIVLKPKGSEEKMKKAYMPEATVRLLINYNKSHKTVVRVNPRLPLEMLLPVICDKCEFNVATTVILRDGQSKKPLDLTRTLNDYGLREVLAIDTAAKDSTERAVTRTEVIAPLPFQDLQRKEKKEKNRGFFSFFRRRKKRHEAGSASAPVSPGLGKRVGVRVNSGSASPADTLLADMPKKRRAPLPPVGASQSVPNNLSACHVKGAQRSAESTLRSTKRRAPPPPCANTQKEQRTDGVKEALNALEELRETDDSHSATQSQSSSPSPQSSQPQPASSSSRPSLTRLHEAADPFLPSFRGRDLSDARAALAKVLTSSLSKGILVKRLRNSAAFPDFHISSCVSTTSGCPDDGHFCTGHESVLGSDLPTESEWEDPLQRKGLTTFKITPHQKSSVCDTKATVAVSDQDQVSAEDNPVHEVSPEVENNETGDEEDEEDPCSPGRTRPQSPELSFQQNQEKGGSASFPPLHDLDDQSSSETKETKEEEEAEVPSEGIPATASNCKDGETRDDNHINPEDQTEFLQSLSADVELCGSCIDEEVEEEHVVQEEEAEDGVSFPPPPPPVYFKEDMEVTEAEIEASAASSLPSFQPANSTWNGRAEAPSASRQSQDKTNAMSSRFAQAVAMAVQRSRLQSLGQDLGPQVSINPHSTLQSPPRSTYQYGA